MFREVDELAIKAESEKDISLIKVSNSKREKGKKMQIEATVEAENPLNLNLKLKEVEYFKNINHCFYIFLQGKQLHTNFCSKIIIFSNKVMLK